MKLNSLPKIQGNTDGKKRLGRGIGSGKGKHCGRGNKGQHSRSGGVKGAQFEGGQMPIFRRLPALKGFKRRPNVNYAIINVSQIEKLPKNVDDVSAEVLFAFNLIRKPDMKVKLLGRGSLSRKVSIKVAAASAKAVEIVTAAGGSVEVSA